ncbi:MAG TPA: hypothetical protein PLE09_06775 [Caldisericia bacterium]|nr:hypothetical protein [Caldisericia bacterium]
MSDVQIIELNPDNIGDYGVCGYKDAKKHIELQKKIDWFAEYYPKGLRISIVVSKEGGYQVLRSAQCPYTEKNVHAIIESANALGIKIQLIAILEGNV